MCRRDRAFHFVNKSGLALGAITLVDLVTDLNENQVEIMGEESVFSRYAEQLVREVFDSLLAEKPPSNLQQNAKLDNKDVPVGLIEKVAAEREPNPVFVSQLDPVVEVELLDSPELKAARRALSQLSVGDWVELLVEDRGMVRCKLSVRLPNVKRYTFVSALGMSVAEMHEDELAQFYVDGNFSFVQDESPETLEALIENRPDDSRESFDGSRGT